MNFKLAAKCQGDIRTPDCPADWVYGWTHYGRTGRTQARMNPLTRAVEIKEFKKWIKCHPGSDQFFTPATP